MFKFRKSVSHIIFIAVLFAVISAGHFQVSAQNPLNFAKLQLLALNISGNDTPATVRPRIVPETKNLSAEPAKRTGELFPNTVSGSSSSDKTLLIFKLEREAFALLNLKRAEKGLPHLVWSDDMARIARSHSLDMAQFNYFSHSGRDGSMVSDRADVQGITKWKAIGENIAYNRGYEKPAEFACERWMISTKHRDNILNTRWKEAGIGVAVAQDGTYYFTQVFLEKK